MHIGGDTDLQQGRAGELPAQLRGEESLQPRPPADGDSGKAFSAGAAALATMLSSHTRYPKEERQTLPETAKGGPRRVSVGGGPTAGEAGTQGLGAVPRLARVEPRHGGGTTAGEDGAQAWGRGHGGREWGGGSKAWGRDHDGRGWGARLRGGPGWDARLGGGAMAREGGAQCLGAGPWRRGRGGAVGAAVLRVTTVRDEGGRGAAGSSAARSAVGNQAAPVGPPGAGVTGWGPDSGSETPASGTSAGGARLLRSDSASSSTCCRCAPRPAGHDGDGWGMWRWVRQQLVSEGWGRAARARPRRGRASFPWPGLPAARGCAAACGRCSSRAARVPGRLRQRRGARVRRLSGTQN